MIDERIERLNLLCRKYVLGEPGFTDGEPVRAVFREIKSLGYSIYSQPCDRSSITIGYLSAAGKACYSRMMEARHKKMEAVAREEFELAADLRDEERRFEQLVLADYIRHDGVAWFRIADRDKKEIICYLYCELLTELFVIESDD